MGLDLATDLGVAALAFLIAAKASASIIALGFGFRGGLFFASLYLGALVGRLFVVAAGAAGLHLGIEPMAGAMVGMGALAVAIIGGPFTMTFLVLETTGDFGLTAATLTASIVSSLIVRETFGYSFSTWRLHLRGETIRSAHDVELAAHPDGGSNDARRPAHDRGGHAGRGLQATVSSWLDAPGRRPGRRAAICRRRAGLGGVRARRTQRSR